MGLGIAAGFLKVASTTSFWKDQPAKGQYKGMHAAQMNTHPATPPPKQAQLGQLREYVENADFDTLRIILPRISGPPGDAKAAMYDAIALLDDRCGGVI